MKKPSKLFWIPIQLIGIAFLLPFHAQAQLSANKRSVQYHDLTVPLTYQGNSSILIIGLDNRPSVLDKSQEPDFVGVIRATAGIPWRLKTQTGNPFINDFAGSIASSLKGGGFSTNVITVKQAQEVEATIANAPKQENDKIIVIKINLWTTDQYDVGVVIHDRKLLYDVELRVLDKEGTEVLSKSFKQAIELSKKGFASGDYKTFIPAAVKVELARILNDQDIKTALASK